jgi:tight adherence protein C
MIGLLLGISTFLVVSALRLPATSLVVGRYLDRSDLPVDSASFQLPGWIVPFAAVGAVAGSALAPVPVAAGATVGLLLGLAVGWISTQKARSRQNRRLGFELPAIADLLALYVLSGESVHGALERVCNEASGVAVSEITAAVSEIDAGSGLTEAMHRAARASAHQDGSRLYELLAEAHRNGARLADALGIFAADRRSSIGRQIIQEGGRRALAGYGPILGLMIPTTLAFLIYPTLAGLDALASAP